MKNLSNVTNVLRELKDNEIKDFADSMSNTQYNSKNWLVSTLEQQKKHYGDRPSILVIGGWYGSYLVPMLLETITPSQIILSDKNIRTVELASILHVEQKNVVKHMCLDAEQHEQRIRSMEADIVINTSCEHMYDMSNIKLTKSSTLYVFQSCDSKEDPGHINTSFSTVDLLSKSGLSNVIFDGQFNHGHKNRFMVMGFK